MRAALIDYFAGEKQAGWAALALGLASLAYAIFLWRTRSHHAGMAIPVAIVRLLEPGVGVGLAVKSDKQVAGLLDRLRDEPADLRSGETSRMVTVQRNVTYIEAGEIVLLAVGLGLSLTAKSPLASAIGMGLLLQAA